MSESNNKEPPKIKIKLVSMKFWIGLLAGILLVSILFIDELNPLFDTPRIIGENVIVYNVIVGIIVGVLVGNGIMKGALSSVLAWAIVFSLVIIKGLIFDSVYSTPLQYSALLLYMILMLALPMALGGAIGGLVREIMKRTGTGIVMKKAVAVLVGIVIILSLYWYSQQSSLTEKPNFDMNGTISNIIIPCPFNVTCNPQYWLDAEDGNTYHLLISSGTRLADGSQQICEGSLALQEQCLARVPNKGQHIEVIGIETNQTDCFENYCENGTGPCKLIPCQPIGTVNVSNWRQR